jgi:hypothetical protein
VTHVSVLLPTYSDLQGLLLSSPMKLTVAPKRPVLRLVPL